MIINYQASNCLLAPFVETLLLICLTWTLTFQCWGFRRISLYVHELYQILFTADLHVLPYSNMLHLYEKSCEHNFDDLSSYRGLKVHGDCSLRIGGHDFQESHYTLEGYTVLILLSFL